MTCALAIGAALNGSLQYLTTTAAPLVVLAAAGCLLALVRTRLEGAAHGRVLLWALVAGLALSSTLPRSSLSPLSVSTHATAGLRRSIEPAWPSGAKHDDASVFDVLQRIDRDPRSVIGTRVQVSGTWTRAHDGAPATVSRQIMTCCAADSVSVGFDVIPEAKRARETQLPASGASVRVSGSLRASMIDGETRYCLDSAMVNNASASNP